MGFYYTKILFYRLKKSDGVFYAFLYVKHVFPHNKF